MLFLLRRIRKRLIKESKVKSYVLYAIGEVILVVIGIMIAVQLNNMNNRRLSHEKERNYLSNIQKDLNADIISIDSHISLMEGRIERSERIMDHMNGKPVDDYTALYFDLSAIAGISHFMPNNVTVTELISSGNLSVISSDSIKQLILLLEGDYKTNVRAINHELFDYEQYISIPVNTILDQEGAYNYHYRGAKKEYAKYTEEQIHELLASPAFKNGCVITAWMSRIHLDKLKEIREKSVRVLLLIESELDASR